MMYLLASVVFGETSAVDKEIQARTLFGVVDFGKAQVKSWIVDEPAELLVGIPFGLSQNKRFAARMEAAKLVAVGSNCLSVKRISDDVASSLQEERFADLFGWSYALTNCPQGTLFAIQLADTLMVSKDEDVAYAICFCLDKLTSSLDSPFVGADMFFTPDSVSRILKSVETLELDLRMGGFREEGYKKFLSKRFKVWLTKAKK
jgi:hypothetical protein